MSLPRLHCPWSVSTSGDVRISQRHFLARSQLLPADTVNYLARFHPRGIHYPAPAGARALAHARERDGCVITGRGALALLGVPYLVEGHDTVLIAPTSSTKRGTALTPTVLRRGARAADVATYQVGSSLVRLASPAAAAIHILRNLDGLPAIQLIDAVRRFTGSSLDDFRSAGYGRVDKQRLDKLLRLSSSLADSPKETEMRLAVAGLAQKYNLTMLEQYPLHESGRLITVFDLVLLEPKIGLMYDGRHHWDHSQRQKDSFINLEAVTQGWTVLRFSVGTLPQLPARLARLLDGKPVPHSVRRKN